MPTAPKSICFARIVHRLLTSHKGYRVDALMRDFDIRPRTYRDWRKTLQDDLTDFHRPDGTSMIEEVDDGEVTYLRLVEADRAGPSDDDYLGRIAAVHFARRLLGFVSDTEIGEAMETFLQDFNARLKDRPFTLSHTLANVDRMFHEVPAAPKDYSDKTDVIRDLLWSLVYTYWIDVTYESTKWGEIELRLAPYTLATHASALYLVARADGYDDPRYYAVDRIVSAERTHDKFDYPSRVRYDPAEWSSGGFGLFRSDDDEETEFELLFDDKRWLKTYVQERRWTPSQEFEELDDGRLRMTFSTTSAVQVWPWIRSFGEDVELVEPDWP